MHVLSCFPSRRDDVYWPEAKRAALDERYHSDFDHQDCFHNFDHRDQSCYPDHSVDRSATDPAHLMHVFVLVHSLSLFFHPGPFSKSLLNFFNIYLFFFVFLFFFCISYSDIFIYYNKFKQQGSIERKAFTILILSKEREQLLTT